MIYVPVFGMKQNLRKQDFVKKLWSKTSNRHLYNNYIIKEKKESTKLNYICKKVRYTLLNKIKLKE